MSDLHRDLPKGLEITTLVSIFDSTQAVIDKILGTESEERRRVLAGLHARGGGDILFLVTDDQDDSA